MRPLRARHRCRALAVVAALAATACAGSTPRVTTPGETTPAIATPAGAGDTAPWRIPPRELSTQRLFRVEYDGPAGDGGFRLTLRLVRPDLYGLQAVDPFGRTLWTLGVEGEQGLWLDHRRRSFCRLRGSIDLAEMPLAPFPLPALPALLLGRVPAAPGSGSMEIGTEPSGERLEYRDARSRRWSMETRRGELVTWTLWEDGRPAVWWLRRGEEAILSQRRDRVQIRWRQAVVEPLAGSPEMPPVPGGWESSCIPTELTAPSGDSTIPGSARAPFAPAGDATPVRATPRRYNAPAGR